MNKKKTVTRLVIALVVLTSSPVTSFAGDRPILDWFSGKFGNGSQHGTQGHGGAATMPEQVYTGTVPPADGRAWVQMATAPDGGALDLVLNVIDSAKTSIRIAAYSFTSKPIAEALSRKQKAGVSVMVVMDKSQLTERYTSATFLANVGIPVRINSRYAIQHSKVLVVDGDTVETGSFNYTDSAAKRNSENVLVIWHHPTLAKEYTTYWQRLWEEGDPYRERY